MEREPLDGATVRALARAARLDLDDDRVRRLTALHNHALRRMLSALDGVAVGDAPPACGVVPQAGEHHGPLA